MCTYKFYKITIEAIKLYLKDSLNEQSLTEIINNIRLEKSFNNEDIYQEIQLIKYLFSIKKYYQIERFIDEFIAFIFNIPCKSKTIQADIGLIVDALEKINEKLTFRIHSQVDIHIYTLLTLNYIEGLNDKNSSIILKNSSYMDNVIGISLAESYVYEQCSFVDYLESNDAKEILSKKILEIKKNIKEKINLLIVTYYDVITLENFINSLDNILKSINLKKEDKRIILYLFNLAMQFYFKQARINWQNKKTKAKNEIKTYTLPLDY